MAECPTLNETSTSHPFPDRLITEERVERWHDPEAVDIYRKTVLGRHSRAMAHVNTQWL